MMFAQANSEHCRHKIFNASWEVDGQDQPHSLFGMIRHTNEVGGDNVLSAYSDNAAVVSGNRAGRFYPDDDDRVWRFHEEPVHLLMKVETQNHPTAISPFSGAGTGAGGEIQLADAINTQATAGAVEAVMLSGRRFDCGSVQGYLDAIIEVAGRG